VLFLRFSDVERAAVPLYVRDTTSWARRGRAVRNNPNDGVFFDWCIADQTLLLGYYSGCVFQVEAEQGDAAIVYVGHAGSSLYDLMRSASAVGLEYLGVYCTSRLLAHCERMIDLIRSGVHRYGRGCSLIAARLRYRYPYYDI